MFVRGSGIELRTLCILGLTLLLSSTPNLVFAFKVKKIFFKKENVMIKGTSYGKNIAVINIYAPSSIALGIIKQDQ